MNVTVIIGVLAAGLCLSLASVALAQPAGPDCSFYSDAWIESPHHGREFSPKLMIVAPRKDPLHFLKGGFVMEGSSDLAGCPSNAAKCQRKALLTADDPVIVTSTAGAYSCATYTGNNPKFPMTIGFLPTAALTEAPTEPAVSDWFGNWKVSDDRVIRITPAGSGSLQVALQSYFPNIPSDGTEVPFVITVVRSHGNTMAFSVDEMATMPAQAEPIDSDPGNDLVCRVQLWRLGPYLVEADNGCGLGNNGTGAGSYRKVPDHS